VIRVAAIGDQHAGTDSVGLIEPRFADVEEHADVLLIAGDLTRLGLPEEAEVLAGELAAVGIPKVAVLGNHDHHADRVDEVVAACESAGIRVLEGDAEVVTAPDGTTLGVAGVKGFGGGFPGTSLSAFGEREMKAFVHHAEAVADALGQALAGLGTDHRVALLHYAPIRATLKGEPPEIYPFLGSNLLAEAVDAVGADLIVHGHAHHGVEKGVTPGGIHVRNVAQPVIRQCYRVYCLGGSPDGLEC